MTQMHMRIPSPIGELLLIARNGSLQEIRFENDGREFAPEVGAREGGELLERVASQLAEYFARRRRTFELPLGPLGTPFQLQVWRELERIPVGETITYGQLARRVGNPRASRAVGAANGKNPLPIIVPCHRVIGQNGKLTGFAGGLDIKRTLLEHESALLWPA